MAEAASDNSSSRRGWGMGMLAWPFIGLVLYALSVGPVAKWYPNPPKVLRQFYAPLVFAHKHVPPVKAFYDWYARLWDVNL